jgi:uncharacterized repeat protein (TIGR01451 family)
LVSIDANVNGNYPLASCTPATGSFSQRASITCQPGAPMPTFEAGLGRWIIEMTVTAPQTTDIDNVASVTSSSEDPNASNNEAYVEHEITDVADLRIEQSAIGIVDEAGCDPVSALLAPDRGEGLDAVETPMADMVTAGNTLTYRIKVSNDGPSDAENVLVYDRLPPGIRVISARVLAPAMGQCRTGAAGSFEDQLVCGLYRSGGTEPGDRLAIGPGEMAEIEIVAVVDPALAAGTILENDVSVSSDILDPDESDNRAYNLTTVKTAADLVIEKSSRPDPVIAGKQLAYTLTVRNLGSSVARNVVVEDLLPLGVTFNMAMSNIGSGDSFCKIDPINAQILRCSLGDLAPGQDLSLTILVDVDPDAVPSPLEMVELVNLAQVSSDTFDPCLDNNLAEARTMVHRMSQVSIQKVDLPDPVIAGKELTYLINFGNVGMSTAVNVRVTDDLPAGLTGLRCAPLDPDDSVTCAGLGVPGGVVTLNTIQMMGQPVWTDQVGSPENDLDPGESYSFYLVAMVDPGYVLDGLGDTGPEGNCSPYMDASGWGHWALNTASILARNKNADDRKTDQVCTRVNAEADLEVEKTDIFGDPETMPDNYFLMCDPVQPGGMLTYFITVRNKGMSDAAEVLLSDLLPQQGVALDPAQVVITPVSGAIRVEEVRDTGLITIVIGEGQGQVGRLDAGEEVVLRIDLMVGLMAECGSSLRNTAVVSTRENRVQWPPINGSRLQRTPTLDPILTNNSATELTKVECPRVSVRKTVSYDGLCPGTDQLSSPPKGTSVTFCIEISNTGTTFLDTIRITDTLRTSMGSQVFTDTIRSGKDPKFPVAPGETVLHKIVVPPLDPMCGTVTNHVLVSAVAVNSGRTIYPCLSVEPAEDEVQLVVTCSSADYRIELPALDTDTCETWLQIQNVGRRPAVGVLVGWGEPGFCPPQAAGPLKTECTGLLKPGSAWSFPNSLLPSGLRSGIVYSVNATDLVTDERGNEMSFDQLVCGTLFDFIVGDHDEWLRFDLAYLSGGTYFATAKNQAGQQLRLDFGDHQGEPLVVSVNRKCPDPVDPNRLVNAAYTGIGTYLEGAMDPVFGEFSYYAPLIFAGRAGLNSIIHVHNSGQRCSSIEVWLKGQDNCIRPILGDILAVSPGESAIFDPNTVVGPGWIGSAWIRASQPLGIVVDNLGPNHFSSYVGVPSDNFDDQTERTYSIGSEVNFAPLIYSEYQGWDSAIQVQNLSGVLNAKVKVYFLDRSGDVVTTLVDWICPRGSQTFFLPVIGGLAGNWVGSVRIESQNWWAPGTNPIDFPRIASVVLLEKWSDPARSQELEAMAYNALTEQVAFDWQVGKLAGGTQSGSAVLAVPLLAKGNRGINSELAITNLVTKPGFTDFAIYLYDQNGLLDAVCQKLGDRQTEYIDLATWGYVPPRFLGSAVISATHWSHEVFSPSGGFVRNLVGLSGVVVERIGRDQAAPDLPGDESKAFEAVPIFDFFQPQRVLSCPGQPRVGP